MDIGSVAPEFSLIGQDDMIHTLGEFRGYRAIVIVFIGEGEDLDDFEDLKDKYHSRGVAFITISSSTDPVSWKPTWVYLHDFKEEVAKRYGVEETPECFLFDQKRHLIYLGGLELLRDALDEHINMRPISYPKPLAIV